MVRAGARLLVARLLFRAAASSRTRQCTVLWRMLSKRCRRPCGERAARKPCGRHPLQHNFTHQVCCQPHLWGEPPPLARACAAPPRPVPCTAKVFPSVPPHAAAGGIPRSASFPGRQPPTWSWLGFARLRACDSSSLFAHVHRPANRPAPPPRCACRRRGAASGPRSPRPVG